MVGYDNGIKNHLGGAAQAEAYIASIWTHLQVNFCHHSLGSKVLIERLPGIKHYPAIKPYCLHCMYADTENDLGSADLMLYMAMNNPNSISGGGIAHLALVCNNDPNDKKKKQSINNYGYSHSWQGELLAHELGHNLGKLTLTDGVESNPFNSVSSPLCL